MDSWEDDAFLRDADSGQYFDPAKLHPLHHRGEHFKVRGPLNVARSPQGRPVVQAGASPAGRDLAARSAEVIFVAHQTFDEAQSFYRDIKRRAAGYGRDPDSIKVMPGIFPVVGHSQAEADEKFARLQDLIHPVVGVQLLSNMIGVDLSGHPVDGPLPELPETNGGRSRQLLLADLARRDGLTIRQLYLKIAERAAISSGGHARAHRRPVAAMVRGRRRDGFNIMSPWLPGGLDDFIELVLPELRRRGVPARVRRQHIARAPGLARRRTCRPAPARSVPPSPPEAAPMPAPVTQPERIRPMPSDSTPHIAIIGGGFAGAVTALAGPRRAPAPGHHHRRKPPRAGARHRLQHTQPGAPDERAGKELHALSDQPEHLAYWLRNQAERDGWRPPAGVAYADSFAPRHLYGDYVQAELENALAQAPHPIAFKHLRPRAGSDGDGAARWAVRLEDGRQLRADYVVLATGLFPRTLHETGLSWTPNWSGAAR